MNEPQTELMLIDPALKKVGWGVVQGSYIQKQYPKKVVVVNVLCHLRLIIYFNIKIEILL